MQCLTKKIIFPQECIRLYLVDKILTKLDLSKDCYFLDIGCGTGEFVLKMAKISATKEGALILVVTLLKWQGGRYVILKLRYVIWI